MYHHGAGNLAKAVLYEGAMYGADRLIHICDPAFAGSDTLATSRILARAIERAGLPDIILCGRRTIDGETGQVGPQLAARLPYPVSASSHLSKSRSEFDPYSSPVRRPDTYPIREAPACPVYV